MVTVGTFVQTFPIGELLAGIGLLILYLVIAWLGYRVCNKWLQILDAQMNKILKFSILEDVYLNKYAEKKGVDLDKEFIKRKLMMDPKNKSFQKKIENEIYEDFFNQQTEE